MDSFMEKIELINFNDRNTPHDRVLVVGQKKFYVQSLILSISSEYFRGLFCSGFSESTQNEIAIEDVDPVHFEHFLRMIYPPNLVETVNCKSVDFDTSVMIGLMSHRFICPSIYQIVKKATDKPVSTGLQKFNFIEFANISVLYDLDDYKELVIKSFKDPMFLSEKKQQIKKAPENVARFLLDAYMDGKMQPENSQIDEFDTRDSGFGLSSGSSIFFTGFGDVVPASRRVYIPAPPRRGGSNNGRGFVGRGGH